MHHKRISDKDNTDSRPRFPPKDIRHTPTKGRNLDLSGKEASFFVDWIQSAKPSF